MILYNRKSDRSQNAMRRREVRRHVQVSPQAQPARKPLPSFRSRVVPSCREVLPALEKWLQQRNYAVVMDQESAAYFSRVAT